MERKNELELLIPAIKSNIKKYASLSSDVPDLSSLDWVGYLVSLSSDLESCINEYNELC
jgi:hypothetical protein